MLKDEKCSKVKVIVDNKNKMVINKNCKSIECYEDEGDYEKEFKEVACATIQLVKDSQGDVERACVMYEKLQEDSVCAEVTQDFLVQNLKDELCRVTCNSQDEFCLEVEDMKEKIDKEFCLEIRQECFEEREKNGEAKKYKHK